MEEGVLVADTLGKLMTIIIDYFRDSAGTFFLWLLNSSLEILQDYFPFFVLGGIVLFMLSTLKPKRW